MTRLEDGPSLEEKMGVKRHPSAHLGFADRWESRVYILHSKECRDSSIDLRECQFSKALERGIDERVWGGLENSVVVLHVSRGFGDLVPLSAVAHD